MNVLWGALLVSSLVIASGAPATARADTLVAPGGKPGVVTSWKSSGGAVVLAIKDGFSSKDVADAIAKGVAGAKASAQDKKVTVKGVAEAALISALQRIEVDPELDDVDSMLAATQGQQADEEGSGSSIRATSDKDMSGAIEGPALGATVVEVTHKKFPLVAVTVRLDDVPSGQPAGVEKGKQITIVPAVKMKGNAIDSSDPTARRNASAWYARPGDRVSIKLGAQDKTFWVATSFERAK